MKSTDFLLLQMVLIQSWISALFGNFQGLLARLPTKATFGPFWLLLADFWSFGTKFFWLFFLIFHHVSDMENWWYVQNRKYMQNILYTHCKNVVIYAFFLGKIWKFGNLAGVKKLTNVCLSSFQLINKPSGTCFTHFVRRTWRIKVFLRPGGKWFVPRPPR